MYLNCCVIAMPVTAGWTSSMSFFFCVCPSHFIPSSSPLIARNNCSLLLCPSLICNSPYKLCGVLDYFGLLNPWLWTHKVASDEETRLIFFFLWRKRLEKNDCSLQIIHICVILFIVCLICCTYSCGAGVTQDSLFRYISSIYHTTDACYARKVSPILPSQVWKGHHVSA